MLISNNSTDDKTNKISNCKNYCKNYNIIAKTIILRKSKDFHTLVIAKK